MKYVVVGCGRHGVGLARVLTLRGHTVTVIDQNPEAFDQLREMPAVRRFVGVGFDRELLLAAGIEQADGLAAVTGNDEVNVVVGRVAREIFRVPRVVARLYDPRKAEIYRQLGLHTIAPVSWGINRIADVLVYSDMDVQASLGNGDVEIVEVRVPALLAGRPVSALLVPGEIHVTAIARNGATFLANGGAHFQLGDVAYLAIRARSAGRLATLLQAL